MTEPHTRPKAQIHDFISKLSKPSSCDFGKEQKKILDEQLLMPNQMLWVTSYSELSFIYKRNIKEAIGYDTETFSPLVSFQMIHHEDYNFITNQIRKGMNEIIPQFIKKNKDFYCVLNYRIIDYFGQIKTIQRYTYPLKVCKNGEPDLYLNLSTDITPENKNKDIKVLIYDFRNQSTIYYASKNSEYRHILSSREKDILSGLAKGKTSDMIGDELCISKHTVDVHRRRILEKTGSKNTAGLIAYAYENGII